MAVVLIVAFGLLPSSGGFARGKKKLVVESAETGQALEITPDGLHFTNAGASRFRMQFGDDWGDITMWGPDRGATWNVHSNRESTASKIFANDNRLRVEASSNLLDSGAGVRLYDTEGRPRATFYTGKWGGKSGLEVTNTKRQARLDLYAVEQAESVLRLNDDQVENSAELSVLPSAEAMYRYTGIVPESDDSEQSMTPLMYMSDNRHNHVFVSTLSDK